MVAYFHCHMDSIMVAVAEGSRGCMDEGVVGHLVGSMHPGEAFDKVGNLGRLVDSLGKEGSRETANEKVVPAIIGRVLELSHSFFLRTYNL